MRYFLNAIALLPMLGFMSTMGYVLMVNEEIYQNHHWFVVALTALNASAERMKGVHPLCSTLYISAIMANMLLLVASMLDLIITPKTFLLFIGFLSASFLLVITNWGVNQYRRYQQSCRQS